MSTFEFFLYQDDADRWHWQRAGRFKTYCSNGGAGFEHEPEARADAMACADREAEWSRGETLRLRATMDLDPIKGAAFIHKACRRFDHWQDSAHEYQIFDRRGDRLCTFVSTPAIAQEIARHSGLESVSAARLLGWHRRHPMQDKSAQLVLI